MIVKITLERLPQFDTGTAAILRDCVEHVDEVPAKQLAKLMSKIQLHTSHLADLEDYLRRYQQLDVKRTGLEGKIDGFTASAVAIAAIATSFFKFARLETNEAPSELDLDSLDSAFHSCGLDPTQDADSWNVLTNRFLPQRS